MRPFLLGLILLAATIPLAAQTDVAPGEWRFLGPDGGPVQELVAAPGNPQVLYAVAQGTIYRSVDGGATWTRGSDAAFHVAVDAVQPSLVYAVRPLQLARSTNGGATWQELAPPAWPVDRLVAHPRFARTVFAVTDQGLFQSTNAGSSWRLFQRRGLPARYRARWLVVDPSAPRRLYLALEDLATLVPRLYKSLDGGASWQRIDTGPLAGKPVLALATRPGSSKVLYASTTQDVYRSRDGGRSWTAIGRSGGVAGIATVLVVPPDRPFTLYAGGGDGLFRSRNAGATWDWLTSHDDASVTALLVLPQGLLASLSVPGQPDGLYRSADDGASWTFASRGIRALTVTSIQFGEPGTLWAMTDDGLFRSAGQGLAWSPVLAGLHLPPAAVATDPSDRASVFVLFSDGALWRSHDGGETWEAGGDAGLQALDLEVDPQTPSTLYAAGYGGIVKSADAGTTWTALPAEPAAFYYDLDAAPSSPSTLYVVGNDGDFNTFFLRSEDGGATWTRLSLFNRDLAPAALAVDPLVATTVYSAEDGVILRSTDAGETWSAISDVVDASAIHPVEVAGSGRIYAAVWNLGIHALDEGSPTMINLGGRLFNWIFTALAPDPHDPCRVYAGAQATSLMEFTYAECP